MEEPIDILFGFILSLVLGDFFRLFFLINFLEEEEEWKRKGLIVNEYKSKELIIPFEDLTFHRSKILSSTGLKRSCPLLPEPILVPLSSHWTDPSEDWT